NQSSTTLFCSLTSMRNGLSSPLQYFPLCREKIFTWSAAKFVLLRDRPRRGLGRFSFAVSYGAFSCLCADAWWCCPSKAQQAETAPDGIQAPPQQKQRCCPH